jgi:hypothetical protein
MTSGFRAGPRAGLGLPKLGLAGLGANFGERLIQDGRFRLCDGFACAMVLIVLWFCLCYGFACAMVLLVLWLCLCDGLASLWFFVVFFVFFWLSVP